MPKSRFSWTSPGDKCALRWFYCLEQQKFCLERMPPKKTCIFAYVICGKQKRSQRTKIGGYVYLLSRRPHAKIELIWTIKKIRPKKSLQLTLYSLKRMSLFSKLVTKNPMPMYDIPFESYWSVYFIWHISSSEGSYGLVRNGIKT